MPNLIVLPRNQNCAPSIVTVDALIGICVRDLVEVLEFGLMNVSLIMPKGREEAVVV
jgi:hypothetical protein